MACPIALSFESMIGFAITSKHPPSMGILVMTFLLIPVISNTFFLRVIQYEFGKRQNLKNQFIEMSKFSGELKS